MVSQTVYSVVIFIHRFLDSDCINFKTFAFLAVYWPFWTLLYNTDIKVQQFFNRSSTMLNNVFKPGPDFSFKTVFAKLSETWPSRGNYGVDVAVTGSTYVPLFAKIALRGSYGTVGWRCDRGWQLRDLRGNCGIYVSVTGCTWQPSSKHYVWPRNC